ncbi:MAG: uroporphyrinogen decarboxylase family protein [Prolixibacteraceae bacterium]
MNSQEQFHKTINHIQPDKVVVDFGSTAVTGIHVQVVEKLRNHYGLENRPVKVIDPYQMLGEVDRELIDAIGIDIVRAWNTDDMFGINHSQPNRLFKTFWGQEVLLPEAYQPIFNENGDLIVYPKGDTSVPPSGRMPKTGFFFDSIVRQEPIDESQLNIEDNLEEFELLSEEKLDYWAATTKQAKASGKPVIATFGGLALGDIALVPAPFLKHPKGIRDITEWYMSTIMRVDYMKSLFEKQVEIGIENLKKLHAKIGDNIDAVFICGTDFGTQTSTFCSPDQYIDLWLPYYRKINDWIHENTSWKTFKHSCGAVESFMPLFIKSGFDIINPVQINASGMDPQLLKDKYGKDLVFWGGGIDTQHVLPYETPEKVKDETLRLIEIFNKDGGFVFNTVHNVQANVPIENVVAMIDAIREYNGN